MKRTILLAALGAPIPLALGALVPSPPASPAPAVQSGGRATQQDRAKLPDAGRGAGRAPEAWEIDDRVVVAVERGLSWLAGQQQPDGSWQGDVGFKLNNGYDVLPEGRNRSHVGVTALAGMAFLANGQMPGRGRYGDVVDRALSYVVASCDGSGYINANGTRMYSHAFATLFLAEALGMVPRPDVRQKLQDAVRLIVDSQNGEGGWRYVPFAKESDMSITVCQVVALRAARNIGVSVPKETIDRAIKYVKESAVRGGGGRHTFGDDERGAFHYQRQNYSRATFPLTAAGIVTLYGAGVYDDRDIELGLDYLERNLREFSERHGGDYGHYFFYYGHYYAVQAMYVAGGERWRNYFQYVRKTLLEMQSSDGTWPNRGAGPGPAFSTAVATLILQIPYRYLPIFQR